MRRRERIGLAVLFAVAAIGGVLVLTYTGSHSLGPLSRMLHGIGAGVTEVESRYVQRVRGAGRSEKLAWLRPYRETPKQLRAPDRIMLGAYDAAMPGSFEGATTLEQALGVTFPLLHFYTAWGDKPEQQFPLRAVRIITNLGSIPVITWEPWLTDFDSRLRPNLPLRENRDRGGLAAIARGDYDFYIDAWARDAKEFGAPLFVRFAHEMNDPYRYPWGPQNNAAHDYIGAWQRVVARFRAADAGNVLFVWAPHVAYDGYNDFYPGAEWVDWVATGVLNFGTVAHWSKWWTFKQIFGEKYDGLARHNKPVMIAELGTIAVGGDRAEWYRDALRGLPANYPLVKSVLFFNVEHDMTVTYQALDWTFAQDTAVVRAVRSALSTWPELRPAAGASSQ